MDGTVIAAGILHDSVEDGVATKATLKREFGPEILFLVDGVTKLGHVKYHGMQRHNESLRKLFVATSKDVRVLIIKFADRIHNLETLEHVRPDKRLRIATESLEIYTQLAYRLGITKLSKELGDLAFPYVHPEAYAEIKQILKDRSKENMKSLEQVTRSLSKKLAAAGMKNFKITHRVKALLALYKKLERKKNDPEKIFDIIAMRVIVPTISDCYQALGIIHQNLRPMPGRIKDYIAFPKPNGYQSIHTTIFTGQGGILEVQIRTPDMHIKAEYGAASHLGYKARNDDIKGIHAEGED
jgi:guanosine-3',5'-bis(diphosphate) 3'-pyrophosphohydrolase